jgi:preprotein translocase subunit SecE
MNRFFNYLSDTRGELKHVSWPTQRQTMIYTTLVIVLSIVTALYLGALDYLFGRGLDFLIK